MILSLIGLGLLFLICFLGVPLGIGMLIWPQRCRSAAA